MHIEASLDKFLVEMMEDEEEEDEKELAWPLAFDFVHEKHLNRQK